MALAGENIELLLLGAAGVGLRVGGRAVEIGAPRLRALLAYLAMQPNMSVSRARLATLLWGERPDDNARHSLRQAVLTLKRDLAMLGDAFWRTDAERIGIDPARCAVDAAEFARLAKSEATDGLRRAASLYSGAFLDGFDMQSEPFDEWATGERRRFAAMAAQVLERLARSLGKEGFTDEGINNAERLLGIDPAHEAGRRLLEELRASQREKGPAAQARTPGTAPAAPGPRLLILPPTSILSAPEDLNLAQAVIEDVTVGLTRYRSIAILAAHTAKAFAAGGDAPQKVNADYAVNAALKPSASGLAMTFRLTALKTEAVILATEIGWHPDELPKVFTHLVGQIVGELIDAIERFTLQAPGAAPDALAYRSYLEGARSLSSVELQNLRRAKRLFRESLARSKNYAAPVFGLARATVMEWFLLGMPKDESLADAVGMAERGMSEDPFDWRGPREKAIASLWLRRHDECLALFEKALHLGPNDADLIADYGDALAHCGEPEKGLALCERAAALNPLHPPYYDWVRGSILFQLGRYPESLAALEPLKDNPALSRLLAACSARAGLAADAKRYAATVKEVYPDFKAESLWLVSPNRRREDTQHYVDALAMAGIG